MCVRFHFFFEKDYDIRDFRIVIGGGGVGALGLSYSKLHEILQEFFCGLSTFFLRRKKLFEFFPSTFFACRNIFWPTPLLPPHFSSGPTLTCFYFAGPLNNRLRTIQEESDEFDLPPPYTPGHVQPSRKIVTVVTTRPPNEPPPPYDIGREATQV